MTSSVSMSLDYLIFTVTDFEFAALVEQFPQSTHASKKLQNSTINYRVVTVRSASGRGVDVALMRASNQGNTTMASELGNAINALRPRIALLVGISGTPPNDDLFIGDVFLPTSVHDFDVAAETVAGRQEAASQELLDRKLAEFVRQEIPVRLREIETSLDSAGAPPRVSPEALIDSDFGDPNDEVWNQKIRQAAFRHEVRTKVKVVDGHAMSSGDLVKAPEKCRERLSVHRGIKAADMESAGAIKTARQTQTPLLVVRGISDVIGLARRDEFNTFAAQTACIFAKWVIVSDAISPYLDDPVAATTLGGALLESDLACWKVAEQLVAVTPRGLPESVIRAGMVVPVTTSAELVEARFSRVGFVAVSDAASFITTSQSRTGELGAASSDAVVEICAFRMLESLLTEIENYARRRDENAAHYCRTASVLFDLLDDSHRRAIVYHYFDILDGSMKRLGDFALIRKIGNQVLQCVQSSPGVTPRDLRECEARAQICALSWEAQRRGDLPEAIRYADKALTTSRQLEFSRNIAFCFKCRGRLFRMQMEEAHESGDRNLAKSFFDKSVTDLQQAVEAFYALGESKNSPEIGECHSLLARTLLSAGDGGGAQASLERAEEKLIVSGTKAFLDMRLLKAELLISQQKIDEANSVLREIRQSLQVAAVAGDFLSSEILARTLIVVASVEAKRGKTTAASEAFLAAARIYDKQGLGKKANLFYWKSVESKHAFQHRVTAILNEFQPNIRLAAYNELQRNKVTQCTGERTLARRIGGEDDTVWRRLLDRHAQEIVSDDTIVRVGE